MFVIACFHSLEAAAATRIADALFAQALYRSHLERMTGARRREFLVIYLRSGGAALAAIAPALVVMAYWHFSTEAPLGQLAAAVVTGVVLWLAVLRATRHLLYHELERVLRRVRALVARPKRA